MMRHKSTSPDSNKCTASIVGFNRDIERIEKNLADLYR
jgi:hypothetical protein